MKRLFFAVASYAFYKWWNNRPAQRSAPLKRKAQRRQPVDLG